MYTRNKIAIIIRIMYINSIRSMHFKIKRIIPRNRHIIRILVSLVMHFAKAPIRVLIIIWNRNYICIAIFIRISCHPHAFQAIPHACLVRKEHCLSPDPDVIFDTVCHLNQFLPQDLVYLAGIYLLMRCQIFVRPIDKLTVLLQKQHGRMPLAFCLFSQRAYRNPAILAVLQ